MADTDVLHLSLPAVYGQEINRIGSVAARPFAGAFPAENSPTAATASFIFETELSLGSSLIRFRGEQQRAIDYSKSPSRESHCRGHRTF